MLAHESNLRQIGLTATTQSSCMHCLMPRTPQSSMCVKLSCAAFLTVGKSVCSVKSRQEPKLRLTVVKSRSLTRPFSQHNAQPARVSQPQQFRKSVRFSWLWAYVLRQLKEVGGEHAQWHLIDTSQSGVTGHSGKVDFCFSAVHQKAWPQVVAMAELKKELQLESQHTECIGQLAARSVDIFAYQEKRNHVLLEVLMHWRSLPSSVMAPYCAVEYSRGPLICSPQATGGYASCYSQLCLPWASSQRCHLSSVPRLKV